jgi:hypothetical protein
MTDVTDSNSREVSLARIVTDPGRRCGSPGRSGEADALVGMLRDGGVERGLGDAEVGEAAEHLDEIVTGILRPWM